MTNGNSIPPIAHSNPRQVAKLERTAKNAALATNARKATNTTRFLVRVTSVRKRLLDEDNLAEKYHVDCARYAGLLPTDAPGKTKIEVAQRKCQKNEVEHVVVEVWKIRQVT